MFGCTTGKHEGQVYIQTSEPYNRAQENLAARIDDVGSNAVAKKPRQVTWRPYLTSSPSRTPTVVTKDLAVWNPMEYPFGKFHELLVVTESSKKIVSSTLHVTTFVDISFFVQRASINNNFAGLTKDLQTNFKVALHACK